MQSAVERWEQPEIYAKMAVKLNPHNYPHLTNTKMWVDMFSGKNQDNNFIKGDKYILSTYLSTSYLANFASYVYK